MEYWFSENNKIVLKHDDREEIMKRWHEYLKRGMQFKQEIKNIVIGKKVEVNGKMTHINTMVTKEQWHRYRDDILVGVSVEFEHGFECTETNVTDDDLKATTKIALRHLAEGVYYYRLLIAFVEYWQEDVLHAPRPLVCNKKKSSAEYKKKSPAEYRPAISVFRSDGFTF